MPLRALFVDFNSFFASVEQQAESRLRNRPVAVVPVLADSTCCIAASYEARQFGIKTGTRVGEAKRMCRELQVVKARPQVYIEYHHRLVAAVESCVPVKAILSIDEMTCDLTGSMMRRDVNVCIAQQIKKTIARKVGVHLTCSIGIAPNSFLAKTATELQKRNGLIVIESGELPQRLYALKLRDLCGIGSRIERRLYLQGILSVEQLCQSSREKLRRVWGSIEGERFYDNLRGEIVVRPLTRKSSLGHSHVLSPEQRTESGARAVMCRLLQKAVARLRKTEYFASEMYIFVKFVNRESWNDKARFSFTSDPRALMQIMLELWQKRLPEYSAPLAVGVTLYNLRLHNQCTLSLFDADHSQHNLNCCVDNLNAHFGSTTIYLGGAHEALVSSRSTHSPIAFQHIPEVFVKAPLPRHATKSDSLKNEFFSSP